MPYLPLARFSLRSRPGFRGVGALLHEAVGRRTGLENQEARFKARNSLQSALVYWFADGISQQTVCLIHLWLIHPRRFVFRRGGLDGDTIHHIDAVDLVVTEHEVVARFQIAQLRVRLAV